MSEQKLIPEQEAFIDDFAKQWIRKFGQNEVCLSFISFGTALIILGNSIKEKTKHERK